MPAVEQFIQDIIQARLDDDIDYRFELVNAELGDGKVLITAKFADTQLDHEVQGDLWAAGMPIVDWDKPDADLGDGSLTYRYAEATATLFNRMFLDGVLRERHGEAIAAIIAEHSDETVEVVSRPYYTADDLMPSYQRLKDKHLASLRRQHA